MPGADFYDYADKYDDGADLLIPAPLTSDELAELQRLAIGAYRRKVEGLAASIFLRGWSRNTARPEAG